MSAPTRTTAAALRALLERAIDYAGLFAPASLDMMRAVNNYSRYLTHPQRWALGRFVLPVARLDEFLAAQKNTASEPWHLSGIISANVEPELAAVEQFNRNTYGAIVDWLEVRVCSPEEIDLVAEHRPAGTTILFEIAPERAEALLPALRNVGPAKLRTGGVVPEAFPTLESAAQFLALCAKARVAFKATAGLHHPLRSMRSLTYEPDSPEAMMHGFLNLLTAAAIAWSAQDTPPSLLATCLADRERADWHFGDDALIWSGDERPIRVDLETLHAARSNFALSFGSCSFEEPMQELSELGLL
jgi:hypothetical protein